MDKLKEELQKEFEKFVCKELLAYDGYVQGFTDKLWAWFSEKLKDQQRKALDDAIGVCKKNIDYNLGKSKHFFDIDDEEQHDDVQHEIEGFMWGWQDSNTRIQEQLQTERDK